jgi:hypothetical protein
VIAATLEQLGLLSGAAGAEINPWKEPMVRNYRGIVTGAIRATFVLDNFRVLGRDGAAGAA